MEREEERRKEIPIGWTIQRDWKRVRERRREGEQEREVHIRNEEFHSLNFQ
jgi:hypothetical protein